ncbi:MAG TPA: formylglycine-generating enzyme family protein [Gemmataceae bacterium]|nr:formylglycine-generating enzyme family protein [Gemmataceae bacterium]
MCRFVQYSLGWCLFLLLVLAMLWHDPASPARGSAPDQAPASAPAAHKAYTEKIAGSDVKFDMVPIPGGTFVMGSPANEAGRQADEGPEHPVTIRPFWMGKTEVTWDEYDQYWKQEEGAKRENQKPEDKAADAVSRPTPPYADETFGHGREGHPVLCITHHAAMEYCRWLSAKTGKIYRLPTEAEWEYAARAGTTTPYFFGSDPKQLGDYAWFAGNAEDVTHEVGKKKPNPWGLYDIYGNVAEWCLDTYKKDYYQSFPNDKPTLSPVLIPNADRFPHVARGGSWADEPARLRSAARRGSDKSWIKRDPQRPQSIWWLTDAEFVGFRIVRPVEEQENLKGLRSLTTRESN